MVAERLKQHTVSFRYAFKGFYYSLKTQPNFTVHFFFAVLAIFLGWVLAIDGTEWAILALTIVVVLTTEAVNTAIEMVTDALKIHKKTEKDDFYIMAAKDIGAGAVLLSALGSVVVGLLIFGPKIWAR